jgi:ABC-type multidrug transport system fused ATPase/permease subunit
VKNEDTTKEDKEKAEAEKLKKAKI